MFLSELPNHIALKKVKKILMSCKKPLSTLTSLNFRLVQQKMQKMTKSCNVLCLKTPKNELLTTAFPVASTQQALERLLNAAKASDETLYLLGATCLTRF